MMTDVDKETKGTIPELYETYRNEDLRCIKTKSCH
jgi:hypothetical protein